MSSHGRTHRRCLLSARRVLASEPTNRTETGLGLECGQVPCQRCAPAELLPAAHRGVSGCQILLRTQRGGPSTIGRRFPLLSVIGFTCAQVFWVDHLTCAEGLSQL